MSQADEVVLTERRGSVAIVRMNRPEYRNAQNSAMTFALDDAFYALAADEEIRVIVLAMMAGCTSVCSVPKMLER